MESLNIVIMAAGKGTRMGGETPKVLSKTRFGTLLELVLARAVNLKPSKIVVVTGFGKEAVEDKAREFFKVRGLSEDSFAFAVQENQLGTGDAVKSALPALESSARTILILSGDMPLVTDQTLSDFLNSHDQQKATLSILSASTPNPGSFGRVVRDPKSGEVLKITEVKDCQRTELLIQEVNSGVYLVDSAFLSPAIDSLNHNNAQAEYYLTDIIEKAVLEGQRVFACPTRSSDEILGVNTHSDLMKVERALKLRAIETLVEQGVHFVDPDSVTVDPETIMGKNITIGPNTVINEGCKIGDGVTIEGSCFLTEVTVGDNSLLRFGIRAEQCEIDQDCTVGPFAHIRPGSKLDRGVKIGNFVETKNAHLHSGAKASHLSYLGDCEIGAESNIGAGTIFCNYDGKNKNQTTIGSGVFVGSNSALVAPLKIGNGAFIGAGSVITKEVSDNSLALTRAEQKEIKDWATRKKKKNN